MTDPQSAAPLTPEQVACWLNGYGEVSRLAASHEALRAALQRCEQERDAMLQQARSWAMEARTQRHTVNEVGSALGGVPDWGPIAESVRGAIAERERLRAEVAKLREALATNACYFVDLHGDPSNDFWRCRECLGIGPYVTTIRHSSTCLLTPAPGSAGGNDAQ